jgi:hypothetical protein
MERLSVKKQYNNKLMSFIYIYDNTSLVKKAVTLTLILILHNIHFI